jgi:hypothetical protein
MIKNLFLVCAFHLIGVVSVAQTSINPYCFFDYQKVRYTEPTNDGKMNGESIGFGIGVEQGLIQNFGLTYEVDVTKKKLSVPDLDLISAYGWLFIQMRNTVQLKYYAYRKIHFSAGINHETYSKNGILIARISHPNRLPRSQQWSVYSSIRIKLQPVIIEIYATKWLPNEYIQHDFTAHDSMSFGLKLGYPILLLKKHESSKVRCPNF